MSGRSVITASSVPILSLSVLVSHLSLSFPIGAHFVEALSITDI